MVTLLVFSTILFWWFARDLLLSLSCIVTTCSSHCKQCEAVTKWSFQRCLPNDKRFHKMCNCRWYCCDDNTTPKCCFSSSLVTTQCFSGWWKWGRGVKQGATRIKQKHRYFSKPNEVLQQTRWGTWCTLSKPDKKSERDFILRKTEDFAFRIITLSFQVLFDLREITVEKIGWCVFKLSSVYQWFDLAGESGKLGNLIWPFLVWRKSLLLNLSLSLSLKKTLGFYEKYQFAVLGPFLIIKRICWSSQLILGKKRIGLRCCMIVILEVFYAGLLEMISWDWFLQIGWNEVVVTECLNFMVHIQYPFYYFLANKKYPIFSILHLK